MVAVSRLRRCRVGAVLIITTVFLWATMPMSANVEVILHELLSAATPRTRACTARILTSRNVWPIATRPTCNPYKAPRTVCGSLQPQLRALMRCGARGDDAESVWPTSSADAAANVPNNYVRPYSAT